MELYLQQLAVILQVALKHIFVSTLLQSNYKNTKNLTYLVTQFIGVDAETLKTCLD